MDRISLARQCYQAYIDKDRAALEAVIADNFHFTSPLDNRIDRRTYFERCWPNSETISDFRFIRLVEDEDRVFVTYEGKTRSGRKFRNTEILTIKAGKITDAEVYFGWTIPHEAPAGGFREPLNSTRSASLKTLYGQLSCSDLSASIAWFEKLFEREPDARPMAGLAEWHHGDSAGLQLVESAKHAGHGTLTLIVGDLRGDRDRLAAAGLRPGEIEPATAVDLFRLRDPDGNLVVMAKPRA